MYFASFGFIVVNDANDISCILGELFPIKKIVATNDHSISLGRKQTEKAVVLSLKKDRYVRIAGSTSLVLE